MFCLTDCIKIHGYQTLGIKSYLHPLPHHRLYSNILTPLNNAQENKIAQNYIDIEMEMDMFCSSFTTCKCWYCIPGICKVFPRAPRYFRERLHRSEPSSESTPGQIKAERRCYHDSILHLRTYSGGESVDGCCLVALSKSQTGTVSADNDVPTR